MSTKSSNSKLDRTAAGFEYLKVARIHRGAYEGSTSYLVTTTSGSAYIMKMAQQNTRQSIFFREALGCRLGEFFGLPMAPCAALELQSEVCEEFLERAQNVSEDRTPKPGLYYGSALPTGPEPFWEVLPPRLAAMYPEITEIIVRMSLFDLLLGNSKPRQYSVRRSGHNGVLAICFFRNSGILDPNISRAPGVNGELVFPKGYRTCGWERMRELIQRITSFEAMDLSIVMSNFPADWGSKQDRDVALSILYVRREALKHDWEEWSTASLAIASRASMCDTSAQSAFPGVIELTRGQIQAPQRLVNCKKVSPQHGSMHGPQVLP